MRMKACTPGSRDGRPVSSRASHGYCETTSHKALKVLQMLILSPRKAACRACRLIEKGMDSRSNAAGRPRSRRTALSTYAITASLTVSLSSSSP
ncbi:hypothetical protein D3C72_1788330 [compost metagenome]